MTNPEVILVEDDELLRKELSEYLALAGFAVTAMGSGLELIASLPRLPDPQVAVLDLELPDIDGRRLIDHLRKNTPIRIVVLTASDEPGRRIDSYERGADLSMSKPVDSIELVAAIRSLAGRQPTRHDAFEQARVVSSGDIWQLDRHAWVLRYPNEKTLRLTAREFQLIDHLVVGQGRVVSRREICQKLYNRYDPATEAALSTLVKRIRQRIADVCAEEDPIRTAHGAGYCFAPPIKIRERLQSFPIGSEGASLKP
jgi:two-component system OmpR family response regulator